MAIIPKIKKKISTFISNEDGKISKDRLLKTGIAASAVAIAALKLPAVTAVCENSAPSPASCTDCPVAAPAGQHSAHCNHIKVTPDGTSIMATHNHCEHCSHSSY